ncbi:MAG: hypothetical protein AAFX51_20610, partial [Cyanobacteria bacterium J06636_28]
NPFAQPFTREMARLEVTTTYLEMLSVEQIVPAAPTDLTVMEAAVPCPEFQRFLYTAVGGSWYWMDRLRWTYKQWLDYISQDTVRIWVGYVQGAPLRSARLNCLPKALLLRSTSTANPW